MRRWKRNTEPVPPSITMAGCHVLSILMASHRVVLRRIMLIVVTAHRDMPVVMSTVALAVPQ